LGLVPRNVTDLVDAPGLANIELHPLSAEETRILLDVASGERLEALYVVAVSTGMRQSELLGLRWADVDLEALPAPVLRVQYQLKRKNGTLVFKAPKTRRSRRQIALAAPAVVALKRHRAAQAEQRLLMGPVWREYDLVFCTGHGTPLSARNVVRSFKALLKKAALADVRFHDLRHTCATLLLGARVNPKVVSEMLGHASVADYAGHLQHVVPDMQHDAASAMGNLLYG
jgi:integrase